jgi:flagellar assembly protein FliH
MSSDTPSAYAFEQLPPEPVTLGGAKGVLADALGHAEQIREQARAEGEAAGRAAGVAAAQEQVAAALAGLRAALEAVEQFRSELVLTLEQDAVELAFGLTERILAGVLEVQPERVVDVARNALRRATERHRVTLVVNPDDLDLLTESVVQLQSELGGIEHCDVQSDRRVRRGGAILRTEAGEIDTTIDAQLDRAREVVAKALRGGGNGR